MKKILVHTRGGLGDQIICNGIINHWSESNFVYLLCRDSTLETLKCLYKDNPNIELRVIESLYLGGSHEEIVQQQAEELDIEETMGIATDQITISRYQEFMYEWADIPFAYRYSKFRLPNQILGRQELYNKLKPINKYALIHNVGSNGANLIEWDEHISPDLDRVFIEPNTNNLLDWIDLIIHAEEIHCIPSGPFHFVDSIWNQVKAKKVFHNSRSSSNFDPNNEFNQYCWQVIEYEKKISI